MNRDNSLTKTPVQLVTRPDGQQFWLQQFPSGEIRLTPVHQTPTPEQSNFDPIALVGIGAACALAIALGAWWIGYASAPRQVAAPSQVVVCQTEREGHLFWSRESTQCR